MSEEKTQSDTLQEAYTDRNLAVMALVKIAKAQGYKAGIKNNKDDPLWPCVFIELPTGQVSWHLPYWQTEKAKLPEYHYGEWDGHTLVEKQERMRLFVEEYEL